MDPVIIAPSYTKRSMRWTEWKAVQSARSGVYQSSKDQGEFWIWFYDGPDAFITDIWLGEVPDWAVRDGYSQEQNDADLADWQANYLPGTNATVEPRAADGRISVRTTVASKGKNFQLRAIRFRTSDPDSVHNVDPITDLDFGDVTYLMFDENGLPTDDPAMCVKTCIDLEPEYSYEIIGGWSDPPPSLRESNTGLWFIACVGAPDIPQVAVAFVSEVDAEAVQSTKFLVDGRATQYLPYIVYGNPPKPAHTNKLRWIVKHPVGVRERFQFYIETFV